MHTQPLTLTKITKPSISSSEASQRTLRRRSGELDRHRSVSSGGAELAQLSHEVQSLKPEEKRQLLEDMDFKIEIPALTGLALKADLCLPWNRMRSMKR